MIAPPAECDRCPRLAAFRGENQSRFPDWHNAPVPSFGAMEAHLIIVGLAPGLKGANRTGRPFTGDYAGDTLYAALLKHGFAEGQYAADSWDGLAMRDARITNAVRCVPPQNKPTPDEIRHCRPFLAAELAHMHAARVILALGRIAHQSVIAASGQRQTAYPFGHGSEHALPDGRVLIDSYHCSRYNTNTGVLTTEMFDHVIARCRVLARER